MKNGAGCRTRTNDLLITNQQICKYMWVHRDLKTFIIQGFLRYYGLSTSPKISLNFFLLLAIWLPSPLYRVEVI